MKPEAIAAALLHCKSSMQDCGTCPAYPAYLKKGGCYIVDDAAGTIKALLHRIERLKAARRADYRGGYRPTEAPERPIPPVGGDGEDG